MADGNGNDQRTSQQTDDIGRTYSDNKTIAKSDDDDQSSPNSDESDKTVIIAGTSSDSAQTGTQSSSSSPDQTESHNPDNTDTKVVNTKTRLVRSRAVCDDVSETLAHSGTVTLTLSADENELPTTTTATQTPLLADPSCTLATITLTVSPSVVKKKLDRRALARDSSQGSTASDGGTSPTLSRDSSFEASYTDATGTNLEEFIIRTLNKNRSDRAMLLSLENEMISFIQDAKQDKRKFAQMSSYHRMLVHRIAAFFGLEHNVDETGKAVIVNRCDSTRIPEFKFRDHVKEEMSPDDQPKKLILRRHRDCTSLEHRGSDRVEIDDRKAKSFEEREEQYVVARNRIFHQPHSLLSVSHAEDSLSHSHSRAGSLRTDSHASSSRDDIQGADLRLWSSTDSSGYSTDGSSRLRTLHITKASSYHGTTVVTTTSHSSSACHHISTATDHMSAVNSPPQTSQPDHRTAADDYLHISPASPFLPFAGERGEALAIWVASSIEKIPAGSLIINPQTGRPYLNADGSAYRWYPPMASAASMSLSSAEQSKTMSTCASSSSPRMIVSPVACPPITTLKPPLASPSHVAAVLPASGHYLCQTMSYPLVGGQITEMPLTYQYVSGHPPGGASGPLHLLPAPLIDPYMSMPSAGQPLTFDAKTGTMYVATDTSVYHRHMHQSSDVPATYLVPQCDGTQQPQLTGAAVSYPYLDEVPVTPDRSDVQLSQSSLLLASSYHTPQLQQVVAPQSYRQHRPVIFTGSGSSSSVIPQHLSSAFTVSVPRQRCPCTRPSLHSALPMSNNNVTNVTEHHQQSSSRQPPATGCDNNVLRVCGVPLGLTSSQLDTYLSDLVVHYGARRFELVGDDCETAVRDSDAVVDGCTVLAVFDSDYAAMHALSHNSSSAYWLQAYTS